MTAGLSLHTAAESMINFTEVTFATKFRRKRTPTPKILPHSTDRSGTECQKRAEHSTGNGQPVLMDTPRPALHSMGSLPCVFFSGAEHAWYQKTAALEGFFEN